MAAREGKEVLTIAGSNSVVRLSRTGNAVLITPLKGLRSLEDMCAWPGTVGGADAAIGILGVTAIDSLTARTSPRSSEQHQLRPP